MSKLRKNAERNKARFEHERRKAELAALSSEQRKQHQIEGEHAMQLFVETITLAQSASKCNYYTHLAGDKTL